jgi:hypothetical protein
MLGEIGAIKKNDYGFDYSNPVGSTSIALKIFEDSQSKKEDSKIDSFIKTTTDVNSSYSKSGQISNSLNKNEPAKADSDNKTDKDIKSETTPGGKELKPEEKKQSEDLHRIDAAAKANEQAHMSAGGGLVRDGVSYQYQKGPDGKLYAVGGEVQIDISPVSGNPEATLTKMQQVRRAALAPADPSGQDKQVAGAATQIESQALAEKQQQSVSTPAKSKGTINTHSGTISKLDTNKIHRYLHSSNFNFTSKFNVLVS